MGNAVTAANLEQSRLPPAADELMACARAIAPLVSNSAAQGNAAGELTKEVEEAFRSNGLFWMVLPKEVGGAEADIITMMDVLEELSFADGSAGWALMACACNTLAPAVFGSDAIVEKMFKSGSMSVVAGQFGPGKGKIMSVEGGYRFSGLFSFASGASAADWFTAGVARLSDGKPEILPNGYPSTVIGWFSRENVEFADNWDVIGLNGTGSIDYRVPEQFLPFENTMEWTATEPLRGGALYKTGIRPCGLAGHSAVMLGIVARALSEVTVTLANKQRGGFDGMLIDHPVFRDDFSRHEAMFQGMRCYIRSVFERVQDKLYNGRDLDELDRQRMIQAATWGHEAGASIVRFCYTWAGTNAIRNPNPLGRCLRDMETATQHLIIDRIQLANGAGPLLAEWADRLAHVR